MVSGFLGFAAIERKQELKPNVIYNHTDYHVSDV